MLEARAFWVTSPGHGEIRAHRLRSPEPGELLIRTLRSAISRGTESLVFRGEVPESEWPRMRCPFQEGEFPAPVGAPERWLLAAIAAAALMLDGADGWAARRQGLASDFGARFDLEVDAFAILVLAITVAKAQAAPYWVLAIGGMRYLYVAAALVFPLLRRPLPPRPIADRRRKTIAVVQSVGLTIALVPATLAGWAAVVCAAALGLLAYSFAADIVILLSTRPHR